MPIYAYRCAACGHARDVLQKVSDPLLTVCREGGPYYPRMWRDDYVRHRRETGREWAALEIESRGAERRGHRPLG